MKKDKETTNDPENYAKLCVPFENHDDANNNLQEFYKGVNELRQKHKISDVLIVTRGNVKQESGEVGTFYQQSGFGSSAIQQSLAAYALGELTKEHEEMIKHLLKGRK